MPRDSWTSYAVTISKSYTCHFTIVPVATSTVRRAGIQCHFTRTRWAVGGQITVHRSPSTGEQLQYLSWLGMAAELRFLEDGRPIPKHLESPPARRNELHLFIGKGISDLRRQTDGAWLVVSNRAVFDRDHRRFVALPLIIYLLSCEPSVATRCGCSLMSSAFQLASALSTIA